MVTLWQRISAWFSKPPHAQLPKWQIVTHGGRSVHTGQFLYVSHGRVHASVQGCVVEHHSGIPTDVYLFDPPNALFAHRHGNCLQLLRPNDHWFKLHWQSPAYTFTQTVAYVEQLLAEALRGA